jgi:hypothetical protein
LFGNHVDTSSSADVVRSQLRKYGICQATAVDDGSSTEDQQAMLEQFPFFTFVFKPRHQIIESDSMATFKSQVTFGLRGHASSMNAIIALTHSTSLFYLDDDWFTLARSDPYVLRRAVSIIAENANCGAENDLGPECKADGKQEACQIGERIGLVLLNDQSSRECAYAGPNCFTELAGWSRRSPKTGAYF